MAVDVPAQLQRAQSSLRDLAGGVTELSAKFPEAFTDPKVKDRLRRFERAAHEAQVRLATPTLSVATLGTTSSGKSTIVNGLIARRVAPIEAGEMSAGVLVLKHGTTRSMTVSPADNGSWETGTWSALRDRDIYERTCEVMRRYHEIRRTRECKAPQVTVSGPMLPLSEPALLKLPPGMALEFIDLPGLKSVQDRANLAVIQERVHKAFSLVALDYLHTDDLNRNRLLEELKRVVEYLEGKTHSMIFLLNRVDARGADDFPLDERVRTLQKEIAAVLSLKEPPEVLPVCARLLYYAECSWGPAPSGSEPATPPEERAENLRALFGDCASWLRHKTPDRGTRTWLRTIEDALGQHGETAKLPSVEDHRKLVRLSRDWSGGTHLWERLRSRLASSFAELVLLPALMEVFDAYESLSQALAAVSSVRKKRSREQVEAERKRLNDIRRRLREEVGANRERFRGRLATAAQDLKTRDQNLRHRLAEEFGTGFEALLDAVGEVAGDLNTLLVLPVRNAVKSSRGVYELEEELKKVVSPLLARQVAEAYDQLSKRLPSMQVVGQDHELRLRADAPDVQKKLAEPERDSRRLYKAMREALSSRAEFMLQTQSM